MANQYVEAIVKAPGQYPENDFGGQVKTHFDSSGELYKITEAYCLVGRFAEACALYERILNLNPAWIEVLDPYARALFALHDYAKARKKWQLFLDERKRVYLKIGIPINFYTIDDVFTSAFGNFTHYYPMDKYGYLSEQDDFYYHVTPLSEGRRSDLGARRNPISNQAMRDNVFERVKNKIPDDILPLLAQDDYITRVPFYCATDLNRRPTHFHAAFAEKMLKLCRTGAAAEIQYTPGQIDECEQRLARMGVDPKRPIVCAHARESGHWGRTGDPTHSTKNADISSFIPAIQYLTDNGYQVVRLGDPSMTRMPEMKFVFDYAHSSQKSDFLDLYLLKRSTFLLCTSSGPFTVASMFNVPVLATNWISGHLLPFLPRDIILMKNFKYRGSGKPLSYKDVLDLDYGEFSYYNLQRKNVEYVDNTPDEILSATKEMLDRLNSKEVEPGLVAKALKFVSKLSESSGFTSSRFRGKAIVSEAKFAHGSLGDD
jgi:putative glycosyltransferase (TIGR04372 family)